MNEQHVQQEPRVAHYFKFAQRTRIPAHHILHVRFESANRRPTGPTEAQRLVYLRINDTNKNGKPVGLLGRLRRDREPRRI